MQKRAIVVGSGAGGATVAKHLQGRFDVTVLEAGGAYRPVTTALPALEWLKGTRLLLNERRIHLFYAPMHVRRSDGIVVLNGIGLGGATPMSAGTAMRRDGDLKALGIDLDAQFDEIAREIPIRADHAPRWRPATRRLFDACQELGLDPQPTPRMVDLERCIACGRCMLGCPRAAKWDSRRYLAAAQQAGARVVTGCRVERVELKAGAVTGVHAHCGLVHRFFAADVVVLAAGGLGTPVILEKSGMTFERRLFVDPVLCVAAEWPDAMQCGEIPMAFHVQRPGYSITPYFDLLSFLFRREWRYPARNTVSLMVRLADTAVGAVSCSGVDKVLTSSDTRTLDEAANLAREILARCGGKPTLLGTLQAAHPGGTLPVTGPSARPDGLPPNLWVADASLLPRSLGNPPTLTIVALAKLVASKVAAEIR